MTDSNAKSGGNVLMQTAPKSKVQPTIEYVSIFTVALLMLAIVLVIVVFFIFGGHG